MQWISNLTPQILQDVITFPSQHQRYSMSLVAHICVNDAYLFICLGVTRTISGWGNGLLPVWYQPLLNIYKPRRNGRQFPDDNFKCIFLNQNIQISIKVSLKFVLMGPINNFPALVQMMAWRLVGAKPLSEPMMVILLTYICGTRPQWFKHTTFYF